MSNKTRGRQKKIEKQKKKRELAKREARARAPVVPTSIRGIVRLACEAPFGPAWIGGLSDDSEGVPALTTVVITKSLPRGQLLAQVLLIDRTCVGVKQASLLPPMGERALSDHLAELGEADVEVERCDLLVAQSVVFHAIDYAKALGFEPHADFVAALVGPRPAELLDTPLAHRARPLYVSGPYDNVPSIQNRLVAALGPGNYDLVVADESDEDGEGCDEDCECGCEGCDEDCEGCDEDCECGCEDCECGCEDCEGGCEAECEECAEDAEGRRIIDVEAVEVREVQEGESETAIRPIPDK